MYDRVSAVIAELIANSYDADATEFTITLPFGKYLARRANDGTAVDLGYQVLIEDNGIGMLSDEVNEYYLKVGTNRRVDRGDQTSGGRPVLGGKGIGKLSPFGICREIRVITAGGNPDCSGKYELSDLMLQYEGMVSDDDEDYHPDPGPLDGSTMDSRGTKVILRGFDRKRVPSGELLHRQISARTRGRAERHAGDRRRGRFARRASGDGFLYEAWSAIFAAFGARALQEALSCLGGGIQAAGGAHRRDRHPDRGCAGIRAAAALRWLRSAPGALPAECWCCAGSATCATTVSGRALERSSPGGARSTSRRSRCVSATSRRRRRRLLLAQHTEEAGQAFMSEAIATV